jgi:8-oxo-dGTP pyrophosphatase MutT (NUDIX family)
MTTTRQFCRFNKGSSIATGVVDTSGLTLKEIPDGGFCLSSFLVCTLKGDEKKVLMGRLDPKAPWDHVGGLDERRINLSSKGWMLPSSHLLYGESPEEGAERIANEQLGIERKFSNPIVASEFYVPKSSTSGKKHWDLEFIYRFEESQLRPHQMWRSLEFVDYAASKHEIARSHEDVLRNAGLDI